MGLVLKLHLLSNHAVVFNLCFILNKTAEFGRDGFIHTCRFRKSDNCPSQIISLQGVTWGWGCGWRLRSREVKRGLTLFLTHTWRHLCLEERKQEKQGTRKEGAKLTAKSGMPNKQ